MCEGTGILRFVVGDPESPLRRTWGTPVSELGVLVDHCRDTSSPKTVGD